MDACYLGLQTSTVGLLDHRYIYILGTIAGGCEQTPRERGCVQDLEVQLRSAPQAWRSRPFEPLRRKSASRMVRLFDSILPVTLSLIVPPCVLARRPSHIWDRRIQSGSFHSSSYSDAHRRDCCGAVARDSTYHRPYDYRVSQSTKR